jgi:hypothetical protein
LREKQVSRQATKSSKKKILTSSFAVVAPISRQADGSSGGLAIDYSHVFADGTEGYSRLANGRSLPLQSGRAQPLP